MTKPHPVLKQTILEVVNKQLENLDSPETKETYDRLITGNTGNIGDGSILS